MRQRHCTGLSLTQREPPATGLAVLVSHGSWKAGRRSTKCSIERQTDCRAERRPGVVAALSSLFIHSTATGGPHETSVSACSGLKHLSPEHGSGGRRTHGTQPPGTYTWVTTALRLGIQTPQPPRIGDRWAKGSSGLVLRPPLKPLNRLIPHQPSHVYIKNRADRRSKEKWKEIMQSVVL